MSTLNAESEIAETALGEIEYILKGEGPVVLALHGGPGGYDQGKLDIYDAIKERVGKPRIDRPVDKELLESSQRPGPLK